MIKSYQGFAYDYSNLKEFYWFEKEDKFGAIDALLNDNSNLKQNQDSRDEMLEQNNKKTRL